MQKADNIIEGEKITNFEYLEKKIEIMAEQLNLVLDILKENNLVITTTKKQETESMDFDIEVWHRLHPDEA